MIILKFRAWYKGEMFYNCAIINGTLAIEENPKTSNSIRVDIDGTRQDFYDDWAKYHCKSDAILMQYTGLKDGTKWENLTKQEKDEWLKNNDKKDWKGKKIYEGDVLKVFGNTIAGYNTGYTEAICEVRWKDFCWSCGNKSLYNYTTIDWVKIKVIGNIYQNPELEEK